MFGEHSVWTTINNRSIIINFIEYSDIDIHVEGRQPCKDVKEG
jgi:hypothetical protein